MVKNRPANTGDTRDTGSTPGLGRAPGEGNGNPLQYSCLENPMDKGAWWATAHGVAKSQDITVRARTHTHTEIKSALRLVTRQIWLPSQSFVWDTQEFTHDTRNMKSSEKESTSKHLREQKIHICCCFLVKSCLTLCDPMNCNPPVSSVHGDSPGKNIGVGHHALLQGLFLTQGLNPHLLHLLHWQAGSLPLVPLGKQRPLARLSFTKYLKT